MLEPNYECGCGRAFCDFNVGTCPREPAGPLVRRGDAGGARDHLVGRPVHCGQQIDRLVGDVERGRGRWVRGRYEMKRRGAELVALFVDERGDHEVRPTDRFRWPLPSGPQT